LTGVPLRGGHHCPTVWRKLKGLVRSIQSGSRLSSDHVPEDDRLAVGILVREQAGIGGKADLTSEQGMVVVFKGRGKSGLEATGFRVPQGQPTVPVRDSEAMAIGRKFNGREQVVSSQDTEAFRAGHGIP
jgi:hypothetical protein